MIAFDQWQLPDGETHLQEWMATVNRRVDGRLTYQFHKYEAAVKYCRERRIAVDAGAHVGLWSFWMARDFGQLIAFEPHPEHRSCWQRNMDGVTNADLFPYALGPAMASVAIKTGPSSSGDTFVDLDQTGTIPQWPLDRFTFDALDFLKIDAEGYEVFILEGAEATINRHRPVVIVEQKPGHGKKYGVSDTSGAELLKSWRYRERQVLHGDYILTPEEWN